MDKFFIEPDKEGKFLNGEICHNIDPETFKYPYESYIEVSEEVFNNSWKYIFKDGKFQLSGVN